MASHDGGGSTMSQDLRESASTRCTNEAAKSTKASVTKSLKPLSDEVAKPLRQRRSRQKKRRAGKTAQSLYTLSDEVAKTRVAAVTLEPLSPTEPLQTLSDKVTEKAAGV